MTDFSALLRQAMKLASSSPSDALDLLGAALEEARQAQASDEVVRLAKHAGAISCGSGRFELARAYFEEALARTPRDGYLHIALSGVSRELGDPEAARQSTYVAHQIALEDADSELMELCVAALHRDQ